MHAAHPVVAQHGQGFAFAFQYIQLGCAQRQLPQRNMAQRHRGQMAQIGLFQLPGFTHINNQHIGWPMRGLGGVELQDGRHGKPQRVYSAKLGAGSKPRK